MPPILGKLETMQVYPLEFGGTSDEPTKSSTSTSRQVQVSHSKCVKLWKSSREGPSQLPDEAVCKDFPVVARTNQHQGTEGQWGRVQL
mmetsp:Transcript_34926/g.75259  ORF Transcript_34926/g.75259 Transcript_34926/m.75259 type:complete len:88 (+) Transcript_34926:530-793(+)